MTVLVNGIPEQFRSPDTFHLGDLDMSSLEGKQFEAVYDALSMAIVGFTGILNQPRCRSEKDESCNKAGEYISSMLEFLHTERIRLVEVRHHKKATSELDERDRLHLLVRYEAECADLAAFVLDIAREGKKWLS